MSTSSRRTLIRTGIAAAAGASGLAVAAKLADEYGLVPPDNGGIYGPGQTLTYAAHRLLSRNSLAREFSRSQISNPPYANGKPPKLEDFKRHQAEDFVNWRLEVGGLVARPTSFSVAELKTYPMRSQITHLACEEGWSYIAEWTGVPLSHILERVGMLPQAKFVVYHSIQNDQWNSLDMDEAMHTQTLVTVGMNGGEIPVGHGGPLRMRVPRQLGYKSTKYINRLIVTDDLKTYRDGQGAGSVKAGYAWYSGI